MIKIDKPTKIYLILTLIIFVIFNYGILSNLDWWLILPTSFFISLIIIVMFASLKNIINEYKKQ